MASFQITDVSNTVQSLIGTESGVIGSTGALIVTANTTAAAVTMAGDSSLTVFGNILYNSASGTLAVGSLQELADFTVHVGATGSIQSLATAFGMEFDSTLSLTNAGTIIADDYALLMSSRGAGRANVVNAGQMIGDLGAIRGAGDSLEYEILNTGSLLAGNGIGIQMVGMASGRIVNTGQIATGDAALLAIRLGGGVDKVVNSGLITGHVDLGLGDDVFDGRGGRLIGDLIGGGGNDLFYWGDGSVRIVETPSGGQDTVVAGSDIALDDWIEDLRLSGAAAATGVGNAMSNKITGNSGDNRLQGAAGNDTLIGGQGNDRLGGGSGFDLADYGAAGEGVVVNLATGRADGADIDSDTLAHIEAVKGGQGADSLTGSILANQLSGGAGADTIKAGSGNDTLQGDRGADELTGSTGVDFFKYVLTSDSNDFWGVDRITDFSSDDLIDLSGIDADTLFSFDQPFKWVGTANLNGVAQLRYEQDTVAGVTRILGHVNSDGVVDLEITLTGLITLTALDFIL